MLRPVVRGSRNEAYVSCRSPGEGWGWLRGHHVRQPDEVGDQGGGEGLIPDLGLAHIVGLAESAPHQAGDALLDLPPTRQDFLHAPGLLRGSCRLEDRFQGMPPDRSSPPGAPHPVRVLRRALPPQGTARTHGSVEGERAPSLRARSPPGRRMARWTRHRLRLQVDLEVLLREAALPGR